MIKTYIILSLAIASAYGQAVSSGAEAAPEPYSYGYETDTHAAAEQKDPNGRVTGYYTLTDADGRARRVEYVADETGFHAKVQTNEVGTKSENSADVEVLAAPPTREQYVYQQTPVAQAPVVQAPVAQKSVSAAVVQPAGYTGRAGYAQYGYGYYPGYGYNSQYGYASPSYAYGSGYGTGYGAGYLSPGYGYASPSYAYGGLGYGNAAYGNGAYSSYNNHLPSSYYRSVQSVSGVQPSSYSAAGGVVSRYNVLNPVVGAVGTTGSSYRSVGVPAGVGYSSPVGSSNYIVLKKRELEATTQTQAEAKADKK